MESVNVRTFRYFDRMLPMQDHLPEGGVGNLIALPLQGQALKEGNSAFIDEDWNAYPDQWKILFSKQKLTREFIEDKIKEWKVINPLEMVELTDILADNEEKPWDKFYNFLSQDVDGNIHITLADGVYVDIANLRPGIQNQIRQLAAFRNPVFYKNQAMGLSNFANARFIYLGKDVNGYIRIPRGLLEDLLTACDKSGIKYEMEDRRCNGKPIDVEFVGQFKESQIPAVEILTQHETGILNAATAFGKTVVCCNIIARKK